MATISSMQSETFVGISHLYLVTGGFGDKFSATGKTVTEVPVAQDGGFTYSGGTPSIDHYKVHGVTGDWTSRMTPGETEINLFIPVVTSDILGICGFTTSTVSSSFPAVADSDDGTFTATAGYTFPEVSSAFSAGIAAINDEGTKMFGIKKVKLLATLVFDSADTAKPIGITLTGSSAASTASDAMGIFTGSWAAPSN